VPVGGGGGGVLVTAAVEVRRGDWQKDMVVGTET
jgi:hypothetical protein